MLPQAFVRSDRCTNEVTVVDLGFGHSKRAVNGVSSDPQGLPVRVNALKLRQSYMEAAESTWLHSVKQMFTWCWTVDGF